MCQQRIDQPRGAAADIDNRGVIALRKLLNQAERRLRIELRPAELRFAFALIDVLPVRLAFERNHGGCSFADGILPR